MSEGKVISPPGKAEGYGIVRDANGGIKVDDWDSLAPELKEAIQEELDNGGHLSNH
jgi:hypothetical protein